MALKDDLKAEIVAGRGISPSYIATTLGQSLAAVNVAIRELEIDYNVYRFSDWIMLCNAILGGNPTGGGGDMFKAVYDPAAKNAQLAAVTDLHANTNDPTADQKAALAGTSGTPSGTNKFVTNADGRNSDARTPTSHSHSENILHSLATAVSDFLVASGAGVYVKKTLAEVKAILGLGTAAYTATADYITHALATAANDFIVASGSGAFVKKTLAETIAILNWAADIATHAALTTAHAAATNLEKIANKGAVSGYAGLDATSKVPTVNLGGAGASASNYLRGDQTWATPAGGGGGMNLLKKTADQTINAGAGVFVDIADLTFPVVNGVDYAFYFYITFQSAATATGWKAGVNCPTGVLDFWARSQIIANGAAGVATHTERHNTVRDDMTLLTTTVTQAVDLAIRIEGRYKCTANGTFAARFANELASNTQIVVQKGSWGFYF